MARIDPNTSGGQNVCAFLDMLAWSEFTSRIAGSDDGYNVVVGGGLFASYADHSRKSVWTKRFNVWSTAAGCYPLLSRYFDVHKQQLGLSDFSPVSQDKIAIQQIRERGALPDIKAGRIEVAVSKCRNIWASLPGAGYGQVEHQLEPLLQQYVKAGGAM
ncbi:glycoside hydrolase family 24 protein [Pandoraea pulmonicola]|uniref:Lysozyme n=1 Tax=Pandoraea pulmonicola TaxID=93221 RepID=A0AAJ5D306_PANPU|nr:glycoside hydrolase family 104 protein [Pandoraea pulmonicola]AJC22647.1 lysozyme [Pandoraea pulmonicola]SUA93125.1 Phage lysozyme [Pandoraea pulmonicola]